MPRTKRPTNKKEDQPTDYELKKLDRINAEYKSKVDKQAQMHCRDIELAYKILLSSIRADILNKTLGELKTEMLLKDVSESKKSRNSVRSTSRDDGYLTENSSQDSGERGKKKFGPPSTCGRSTRRSRSADASARRGPTMGRGPRSQSVYRTPAFNRNAATNYPPITPKVAPNTSLAVLRHPRQGEMVVSMSGSPVMIPSFNNMQREEKANCNVMLRDGTMLSFQPKQLRSSLDYIPYSLMDSNVLHQLKTLKDNLDKVVKMGEKAVK